MTAVYDGQHEFSKGVLPFYPMRLNRSAMPFIGVQMREFMQGSNQKAPRVQVAIYGDAVSFPIHSRFKITEFAFPATNDFKNKGGFKKQVYNERHKRLGYVFFHSLRNILTLFSYLRHSFQI
jgi:hypothetical protein